MSLIDYIEPIDIFGGLATLLLAIVGAAILWKVSEPMIKLVRVVYTHFSKRMLIEDVMLEKIAKESKIDLTTELYKLEELYKPKRKIGSKIDELIYEKMFGKEE